MPTEKRPIYIDLLTDNMQIVRIESVSQHEDEMHDLIRNAIAQSDWLCFRSFDNTSAQVNGIYIDRIHGSRILAIL